MTNAVSVEVLDMARVWSPTLSPPEWDPGPGRLHYLREDYYFFDTTSVPVELAARVTARVVVRWCDRYEAYPLTHAVEARTGTLADTLADRESLVDSLIDWLLQIPVDLQAAALNLYRGKERILDQHDGMPGILALRPEQFSELQLSWHQNGLPRDLYYSAEELRSIVEPVERYGGVFLVRVHYSPQRWARRNPIETTTVKLPSEHERAKSFALACRQFMDALKLRISELSEPGRKVDEAEIKRLGTLHRETMLASFRAGNRDSHAQDDSSQ